MDLLNWIVIVVVLILVAVFFYFRTKGEEEKSQTDVLEEIEPTMGEEENSLDLSEGGESEKEQKE